MTAFAAFSAHKPLEENDGVELPACPRGQAVIKSRLMESREYQAHFDLEERHWWFRSRRRLAFRILGHALARDGSPRILDAGCGTWINLSGLAAFGDDPKARECAARTTIKIQHDFADSVRNAYVGWRQKKGDTASRLLRGTK
ncbi:MAG: hypothetical protein MUP52_03405 [Candidatus Aminicenantes bacterium]|nr:hypothetical protein [Candidatus Aminicenantes bacterium]